MLVVDYAVVGKIIKHCRLFNDRLMGNFEELWNFLLNQQTIVKCSDKLDLSHKSFYFFDMADGSVFDKVFTSNKLQQYKSHLPIQ